MPETILDISGLSKVFASNHSPASAVPALEDVSLTVFPGETIAVVGPSGSGKTTLISLCAGLDRPTSGGISVLGVALNGLNERELAQFRNRHVGFVFQTFQLLPTLTAIENVMVPAELRGCADARTKAEKLLVRLGLKDRLQHYPLQLSGGEQQRVALARAYVNDARLILADEPTGNLDSNTAGTVIDLMLEFNERERSALVLVTHDQQLANRANRLVRLERGRVVNT